MDATKKKSMAEPAIFLDIVFSETAERTLCLDLRVPSCVEKPPLVLYIPMGGMSSCPKEQSPTWLVEHGFAMASIECRVSSEAIAPAAVYDCKAAVRWLRRHADGYGYRAEAIGVWGHSAGGLLAALLATSGDAPELEGPGASDGMSSCVQAACDKCGVPHDLAYFARPAVKSQYAAVTENLRRYLGAPVEERLELARLVSPWTYISSSTPPMLLIHGEADSIVPVEEMMAFHQALRMASVDATLRLLPGIGHGWDMQLTRRDIVAFFKRTLIAGSKHRDPNV